jgi:phosphatidylserine decarboxylase
MIAKKCYHIAFAPFVFLVVLLYLSFINTIYFVLFLFFIVVQGFFIFFFRDMPRTIHQGVISPVDGKVVSITATKVSIFMSIFDMHVNLMPYNGTIRQIKRYKGIHRPAYGDITKNMRVEIDIDSKIGLLTVVQITGIVAQRIINYISEGDTIKKGEKIGIIRFGSRVECALPSRCKIIVKKNQKVKAGETIATVEI